MDARVFRRVQRYGWDAAMDAYDRAWVPLLDRLSGACVARAGLQPGERVLDVATGPGVAALLAAEAVGPAGAVTGVDISANMIARAHDHARSRGIPNVRFERGDMESTGAVDGAFDAAVCAFGLMYAADRAAACAELARVLRSGGRTAVAVWGRRSHCKWAEVFPIVDAHVESEVCPMFFFLGQPGGLTAALGAAGFRDVVEERLPVTLTWSSADDACEAMLEGGPVALAWKRFSPDVRAQVREAYLTSIAPYRVGAGYQVPSEVVFGLGRKATQ